ncbi:ABC transporter permease [Fructobacillus sp. M1-13]|uniref:Putative hemin transport system permease protein HrtB n=1 Tax=Fructobacillus papyriferae TaxID=2713171 RepID=A0ABS5QQI7_9LACO|nr:ABC transporter permease [Fructobacillus papyriferae]MBS9335453.1 ABC transporter permease [Fructobacillus papyriferae]MCD2159223.1 ABC transporter permease [Fructobacillus papyriferae]
MFLALKEMKKEKLRYGLVIGVVLLVAYLIFMLSALAQGLSGQNTAAVNSWQSQSIMMSKDANGNLAQSMLTAKDLPVQSKQNKTDRVGLAQGILKVGDARQAATFVGLQKGATIRQTIQLTEGRLNRGDHEIVLSDALRRAGFKLNQEVKMGMFTDHYRVVGFAKAAFYNMSPVVYGDLSDWAAIKGVNSEFVGSGLISQENQHAEKSNEQILNKNELFNKMPGYSAQNMTFAFMIGFLVVISIVIVAIFLYILTMQKIENLAVLRAQGIPTSYLLKNTLAQTMLIMLIAVGLGTFLAALTGMVVPMAVPMQFDPKLMSVSAILLVLTGLFGAIIPMRIIAKIDPISVIGG